MCVCMCVCERERQTDRQTDRDTERDRERERERDRERERETVVSFMESNSALQLDIAIGIDIDFSHYFRPTRKG